MNPFHRTRGRAAFQFSLRALVVLLVVISIGGGWLGGQIRLARRQQRIVAALERRSVSVMYDFQFDANDDVDVSADIPGPRWLRDVIGNDVFRRVVYVDFAAGEITDEDLRVLRELTSIRWISLNNANISDEIVVYLLSLRKLESAELGRTTLSNDSIARLRKSLPGCRVEQ